ncbi:MAG TPA: SDR family NAD(P)-dependent oxidoreductase [Tepidiformaceae bacterium]|nr:SDR family NAD(P)-dependent oxidoreductase [Tepidiformaceae bacterium]
MGDRVKGKIAVLFGAGQTPGDTIGNGRATAILLAREGATVIAVDRDLESAQETARLITGEGGACVEAAADVVSEADVARVIADVLRDYGRIDILHNNVGASLALGDATATELETDAFDRLYQVNLRGMWLACKHVLPAMQQQGSGSIVNISSMAAWEAYPYVGYKTTKAGVIALTQNIAMANARYGVRANVILPGLMNTPMAIEARVAAGTPREEVIAQRDARVPLGRKMGSAWDVAYASLFLHSDEAKFITGVSLPVDGGASVS